MEKKHITSSLKHTPRTGEHACTRNPKVIKAPQETLYQAFTDPEVLAVWLAPGEMTGKVHSFDLKVGGGYRMSLYYPQSEKSVQFAVGSLQFSTGNCNQHQQSAKM